MAGGSLSLILLPTLKCNANCDYCFENRSEQYLDLDQLAIVLRKVLEHMEENHLEVLSIYWQGGEVLTLPPEWFQKAHDLIRETAAVRKKSIFNFLQSNLIGYSKRWNRVISEMFGNSVGSSMDYPNLYRKLKHGGPNEYDRIWVRKLHEAREAGIEVGVIAIPNDLTVELGAERFYSYFSDELGISSFQINTPFPGGSPNKVKQGFPLENVGLHRFFVDLAKIWIDRGLQSGVRIGPINQLIDYFIYGNKNLLCIWRDNCTNEFVCIDPHGNVAQCDCWVTGYPGFWFGNILGPNSLTEILEKSDARRSLRSRPGLLIRKEDCMECDYLSICHGGCPVRAYTVYGDILQKDPYCELYRKLFRAMENLAAQHLKMMTEKQSCGKGSIGS